MADTGIMCSGSWLVQKAGSGAAVMATAEAYTNQFMKYGESYVNVKTKRNWSDLYPTLNSDVKFFLADAVSSYGAMLIINYDMSGYSSKDECRAMLNLLRDSLIRNTEILAEIEPQTFMLEA